MKKLIAMLAIALLCASGASARPAFAIDGNIGLQSFVSLTDAHVEATLRGLEAFAASSAARSGNWSAIEGPLRIAAGGETAATAIYATPDGRYWVAGRGLQPVRISDRPYFVKAFAGKTVVGDLIVSRAADTPVAMVAVPVRGPGGRVIAMVSAGIDLAKLTARLIREMGIRSDVVFWAVDAHGITALHSDPKNIFNDALKVPDLKVALAHMIATDAGIETYAFRGAMRTSLYRHSTLTGWTYGFGVLHL